MIFLTAMIAAIAGFLFGYDEGIIAGSLHLVVDHFDLQETQVGYMTSALPFGALFGCMIIGSFFASRLLTRISRRATIIFAGLCFFIGALSSAFAPTETILTLSRFILGIAIGIAAVTTPLYISETAPAKWRGALVAMYQLAITIGIVCAYSVNYLLVEQEAWREMFASAALPAVILVTGILFLPESPRWLFQVGRKKEAEAALQKLRGEKQVGSELSEIAETIRLEKESTFAPRLWSRQLMPCVALGVLLFFFQQFSGINVVIYYAPVIFKNLGFDTVAAQILATMGIGLVNMLVTVLALFLVDSVGRRKLLLFGFTGTALSLGSLSLFSLLHLPQIAFLSVLCISIYIFAFAISLGPVPYIIMSEIFPLRVRGSGMAVSSISNWGCNGIVVLTFPLLLAGIGIEATFLGYALVCLVGLVYTYIFMPETKHISLEDIEKHLLDNKPLRTLGN